ncbi:TonB-dependent receptor [Winogradskyella maritima]|nr:TonB-dependent receptor [Winogradskyella maritima]
MVLFAQFVFAQNMTITGKVTDNDGLPLPGVNILIIGTTSGTQSDIDGNYSLNVENGSSVQFSYIGFKTQTILISSAKSVYDVSLQEDNSLEEVIVIGYGSTNKRKVNGNIASVTSEDIKEIPVSNFQNTLVGKLAGVQITQVNGKAESGVKIRVRGVSTVNQSQEPLYVIDGIPITNIDNNINDSPVNPLLGLNPSDIESIQILKDASAGAIYGSRATNGVVLITTKSGKEGRTKVSLNSSYGWSEATNRRDWLNTEEYVELFVEANLNAGFTEQQAFNRLNFFTDNEADWREGLVDVDWQDFALVDGSVQDVNVSVSGGNAKTKYFISAGYNKTEAIIRGNTLERYNLRTNIDHDVSEKFKIGTNIGISKSQISRLSNDNAFATPLQAVAQVPYSSPYLEDGITPNGGTLYYNFLFQEFNADHNVNIWRNFVKIYGEYKILDELKFRSEIGYDVTNQTEDRFFGSLTESASTNGFADAYSFVDERYVLNNFFTYDNVFFEKLNTNFILGMSFEDTKSRIRFVEGQNFASDDLQTVDSAGEIVGGGSNITEFNFLSYFARSSMNYDGKYFLDLSARIDASSRFGTDTRYGTFPAASAGWIVSEEDFFDSISFLQYLKARVSWGITGNGGIPNFASRTSINGGRTYNQNPGLQIGQLGDSSLKWEETTQTNFGLDFGFLKRRLNLSLDYYNKQTTDLLLGVPIPGTNGGGASLLTNAGDMENKGLEVALSAAIFQNDDFSWDASFNYGLNKNEVLSLGVDDADIINGQNIARVGEPVSSFYLVEYAGVNPANGDALFYRNNVLSDGSIDRSLTSNFGEASRIIAGNPYPETILGITNTFRYKQFDASFTFQGQFGASIYNNGGRFQSANGDFYDNQSRDQLNRWQQPGDITSVPQARFFGGNGTQTSTRYLQNADFVRLRNLSFGYTLPKTVTDNIKLDRLRVYLTAVNLLTFTDYDGWDPEATADFNANNSLRAGIDFYSAPPAKTITLGVNVDF